MSSEIEGKEGDCWGPGAAKRERPVMSTTTRTRSGKREVKPRKWSERCDPSEEC